MDPPIASPSGMNMNSDDAELVDHILTELNNSTMVEQHQLPSVSAPAPSTLPPSVPTGILPPTLQTPTTAPPLTSSTPLQQIKDVPANVVVEFNGFDGRIKKILKTVRLPLLATLFCFLLFNPILLSMLARWFPDFFGFPSTTLRSQLRTLFLSICVALVLWISTFFN